MQYDFRRYNVRRGALSVLTKLRDRVSKAGGIWKALEPKVATMSTEAKAAYILLKDRLERVAKVLGVLIKEIIYNDDFILNNLKRVAKDGCNSNCRISAPKWTKPIHRASKIRALL
jgi:hypothetical protein